MALRGTDDEKIKQLCLKTHKEQAIWFLNGFWTTTGEPNAEQLWKWVLKFNELDEEEHKTGHSLDELHAHRFLEFFKETQTVMEMRTNLREVGAIPKTGRPKDFPLTHFLIAHFKADWHELVNSCQGDNKEEIAEAQRKLDLVQAAFEESDAKAKQANEALLEAQSREAAAHRSAEASRAREEESKQAKAELEAALAEVKAQEDAYNNKTQQLTAKSEAGGVSGMKAKNELAQHLAEDPLPLRKAKITAEAAVKKSDRAVKAAADAREKAENDAKQASAARGAAEEAKAAAEAALEEARVRLAEAEAFLQEVKSKPGQACGAIWWMERELLERKRFLPVAKGGIRN